MATPAATAPEHHADAVEAPAKRRSYPAMACPECCIRFAPTHHRQHFCTPQHSRAYNARQLGRGQAIVTLAQGWRGARGVKNPQTKEAARYSFTEFCRLLDQFNTEDREAGRLPAVQVTARRRAWDLFSR